MTDIPADVLALRKAIGAAIFDPGATEGYKDTRTLTEWQTDAVMRAILADRAAQAERIRELEDVRDFVARWAWRTDPPNANNKLSDTERLSCIKHHPTIKLAAEPHIELAEAEAAPPPANRSGATGGVGGRSPLWGPAVALGCFDALDDLANDLDVGHDAVDRDVHLARVDGSLCGRAFHRGDAQLVIVEHPQVGFERDHAALEALDPEISPLLTG